MIVRILFILLSFTLAVRAGAQPPTQLETDFRQPPISSRPRTLWMWMNGNVTVDGITRDLEAMRRAGLGGALVFNVGEYIPKGPVDYGADQWRELMLHAAREASRLGLELAMHNCPGWSSSGGPWITPAMSMQQLVWSETRITGGREHSIQLAKPFVRLDYYRDICVLAFPSLPGEEKSFAEQLTGITDGNGANVDKKLLTDRDLSTIVQASPDNPIVLQFPEPFEARAVTVWYTSGGGTVSFTLEASDDGKNFRNVARLTPARPRAIEDGSLVETFAPVRARYFRLFPARGRGVCDVELHASPRIPAWNYKANHSFRPAGPEGAPTEVAAEFAMDPSKVIDLTRRMNADGRLQWNAPAGSWTILRLGHTARGQQNIAAPDAGVGLECDKMSREATRFFFEHGLGKLIADLGPLAGKTFTALEVDSYEVGVQNWTSGFEKEFRKRNGYDLLRYLPAMTGRYVGSADISEKFLWDLRRTHAQLVADYYYGELHALCERHRLKLLVEPYGAGPGAYDELQIAGRADLPMGEFWAHFPWDDTLSIRLAASAAHVNGRAIVAAEAFTATEEQSRFLDHPYALKTAGNLAFSFGLNQMYFHRFAHQPHPTAVPGMTMGPWGFNFDRNNTWFGKSSPWLDYLARCQFMLRQGNFVADVLYFTGEGSPQMSKHRVPEMPPGCTFDAVDAEVLLRARVKDRRVVLSGGGSYRFLLLPVDLKSMTPEVLRKLSELVADGAIVIGPKPKFSPSLRDFPKGDIEVRELADKLWGRTERSEAGVHVHGKGHVVFDVGMVEAWSRSQSDFEFDGQKPDASIVWTHRRAGDADIYFVANRQRRSEEILCRFRVEGKRPEFWFPDTGELREAAIYSCQDDGVSVPLRLDPAGSVFVVFRSPTNAAPSKSLARNGEVIVCTKQPEFEVEQLTNSIFVTNTFTVEAWIKPDTDLYPLPRESLTGKTAQNGRSYVIPFPDNDRPSIQGAPTNEAVLGIAVGRNGVCVIEGSSDMSPAVLVSRTPISGWTHLAVVYRDGKPSLYLNGKLDHEGLRSGRTVWPGVGFEPPANKVVYYFDGDMTPVKIFREALSEEKIVELAAKGLPKPEGPPSIETYRDAEGRIAANVWEAGEYSLDRGGSLRVPAVPAPVEICGPWDVSFPEGSGVAAVTLTNLASLKNHPDAAVRFFAGQATYRTSFELSAEAIAPDKQLWLDLGRVAVIAEVQVNGRDLGRALWKPPYRMDISGIVRPGPNHLEVRVTTLLVNRLIGDESLPAENEYDSRTRAILRLPDWFKEGKPKPPGGRSTFATWKFYKTGDPLVESGLLGPVSLLTSVPGVFKE